MRAWLKGALGAGIVVAVVVIAGAALVDRSLDQDRLRLAVIGSIERQSGRTVTLQALTLRLLPSPRIEARGFTLGNPDGDRDPVMLRLGAVQARLGIWPLLRHVVRLDGLRIEHVGLVLDRGADGRANWQMGPKRRAAGPGGGSSRHAGPWGVSFGSVQVLDAAVSLRDLQAHRSGSVQVTQLNGEALQGERPWISVAGLHGGAGFTIDGTIGPIARLFGTADRSSPWPLSLRLSEQVDGRAVAQGSLDGTLADPRDARGYDLAAHYSFMQLADLNRLFSHAGLPAVQGLQGSLVLVDTGHPQVTELQAQGDATTVPTLPGLRLSSWSVRAADAAAPVALDAQGIWGGRPVRLHGTAGTLGSLQQLRGIDFAQAALPLNLQVETSGATIRAEGRVGGERSDLRLNAAITDLPALLPGAPALGPIAAAARLAAEGGRRYRLSGLSMRSEAGDLAGELGLSLEGRPALTGTLTSARLDTDRLRWSSMSPSAHGASPAPVAGPAPASAPAAASPRHPLPWATLRQADLDLAIHVDDLLVAGQSLHGFAAHAVLQGGRLLVDPIQAAGAAGPVSAKLAADASAAPPRLEMTMHPLFLPAAALAGWLGQPVALEGAAELVGVVQAQGETGQALAASATGHVGVSLVDGVVQNDALLRLLGHSLPLSMALPKGGTTVLRCLALHAALADGVARFDTISLRASRASVDGHGSVGLQDGVLDLHLVPFVALGEAGASMPVRIGGTLRRPRPALDAQGQDSQAGGGRTTLVIGPHEGAAAQCDAALRSAREDIAGPPPAAVAAAPEHKHKNPKPLDILRGLGLFR